MGLPFAIDYDLKNGVTIKICIMPKKSLPKFENYLKHIDHSQNHG